MLLKVTKSDFFMFLWRDHGQYINIYYDIHIFFKCPNILVVTMEEEERCSDGE